MSNNPEERRICLVCGRVLDYWSIPGEWRHSIASQDPEETDHPVIAVLPEEAPEQLRARCDFCYADEPEFVLPARTFVDRHEIGHSVGDWAACQMCAALIEKNAWNRLMDRVRVSWETRHGPMSSQVQTALRRMYRDLRKNITGPLRREEKK